MSLRDYLGSESRLSAAGPGTASVRRVLREPLPVDQGQSTAQSLAPFRSGAGFGSLGTSLVSQPGSALSQFSGALGLLSTGLGAANLALTKQPTPVKALGAAGTLAGGTAALGRTFPGLLPAGFGPLAQGVGGAAGLGLGIYGALNAPTDVGKAAGATSALGGALTLASMIPGLQFLLPFGIAAGAGGGVLGLFGGGDEQAKNQAHEARVLQRDLAVAGPQASAGQHAVSELASVATLPVAERGKRLQELEHSIRTGLGAGPVFSRAGGPDRGTQDLDLQIGQFLASDMLANMGLKTLTGAAPRFPGEALQHLTAYAYGPKDKPLPYDPTDIPGMTEESGQVVGPGWSDPPFAPGQFEKGIREFYSARYPDFANSPLVQRLEVIRQQASTSAQPSGISLRQFLAALTPPTPQSLTPAMA